jgi:uncharacterized membrane-anchored protein
LDRTLRLGYVRSSIMLLCAVIAVLVAWHFSTGEIVVDHITTRKNEIFYWVTILVSNTLGTAMGDFVATTTGLGFERGALVFAGLIALVGAAHFFTNLPDSEGGLALGRITSSLALAVAMIVLIAVTSQRKRVQDA